VGGPDSRVVDADARAARDSRRRDIALARLDPDPVAGQIGVRFDANVHPGLPWRFEPEQNTIRIQPGAKTKIFYSAQNLSARAIAAQAVYNVSPESVGKYFKKIQCFCFSEQTLQPGQKVDMPVVFFVDPAMNQDRRYDNVRTITLSYTFFEAKTERAKTLLGGTPDNGS